MRQSMPFVYFYLDISSADGAAHNIRVYSDIDPRKSYLNFSFDACR